MTPTLFVLASLLLILVIYISNLGSQKKSLQTQLNNQSITHLKKVLELENEMTKQKLETERTVSEIKSRIQEDVNLKCEEYRRVELEKHLHVERISIRQQLESLYEKRMQDEVQKALTKSISVRTGKITEKFVPFISDDFRFDASEATFIGNPIDFIVFENLHTPDEPINIHFIEVKTGKSKKNKSQERIFEAVEKRRVFNSLIQIPIIGKIGVEEIIHDKNQKNETNIEMGISLETYRDLQQRIKVLRKKGQTNREIFFSCREVVSYKKEILKNEGLLYQLICSGKY